MDEGHAGDAYEAAILAAGGIDLQILGIGSNGHIGFNEPGSPFSSRTRAVTQGLATIFEARHLLLIAHGPRKAQAINRALRVPVTEDFPASLLQLHPRVAVVLDRAAAAVL
ncbi:hypothetical protein [Arthrobacter sp. UYCu712]|uniref:hypothetical protein n=1 Tax=Arthrobacter sp. UYCu712 TaxID=3156340 RepID=UPI0033997EB9